MKTKFNGILTLLLAFVVQFTFAQSKTISGTVSDKSGSPLPGVSILIKGTTTGAESDFDGNYSVTANIGNVLQYSFIGMSTVEKTVGTSNIINVTLTESEDNILDEVVVTAYGTAKKESLTGSIKEIKSAEITNVQSANVVQGLAGKVAGVQIIQSSGQPGNPPIVRFRGIGSINASSAPLYVVDGVPFTGNINSINPQDIESATFLKDAAAAALYGNRGANGVIILTTKKGKTNKVSITFDSRVGFNTRSTKDYDIIDNASEYLVARYNGLRNNFMFNNGLDAQTAANVAAQNLITNNNDLGTGILPGTPLNYNPFNVSGDQLISPTTGRFNSNAQLLYQENWDDYLYKDNVLTQTFLSMSKSDEKSDYYFSMGYEANDGYVVNSGFQRVTTQLKLNSQALDFLKIGGNLRYTNTLQKSVDGDGTSAYSNPLSWSRSIAPIYPVFAYAADGTPILGANGNLQYDDGTGTIAPLTRPYGQLQNPVATALLDVFKDLGDNVSAKVFTDFKINDDLTFTYSLSGDLSHRNRATLDTPLYGDASINPTTGLGANGRVFARSIREFTFTQQQLLNWKKSYGNHNLALLLGHENSDYNLSYLSGSKSNILLPSEYILDFAAQLDGASNYERDYSLDGYFSRLTYDYNNKYYINASVRRDASSVFHPDNRWGTFYGIGGAWRVSKEEFLNDTSWLNELKIKASYGEQGNDAILYPSDTQIIRNYYAYRDQYALQEAGGVLALSLQYLGNKDLTWETNQNFNIGFETRIFDNRLSLEVEYFNRKVTDMLFNKPLPPSSGNPSFPENIGDMENNGVEVTLSADVIKTDDFNFSFSINGTQVKNEITRLPQEFIDDGIYRFVKGRSRYDYYLKEYAGVNPNNGAALYYKDILDVNGDPTGQRELTENFTEATEYFVDKTAIPDIYGGFSANFDFKGFDLGLDFSYQLGGYGYDSVYWAGFDPEAGANYHRDVLTKTWTPENTTASLPRLDTNVSQYRGSSIYLTDASYLSLQNISFGYTLPSKFASKIGIESLRIYGLASNVALWSKRQGYDPRLSLTGASSNEYSILSTKSLGVTLKF